MNTEIKLDCKACRAHLPDILLEQDYAAKHPELTGHLEACTDCRTELNGLLSTFALLDEYAAPEPSMYFDSRLHARLREDQAAGPESLWERMRSYLTFSTGRGFQPAMACTLALLLLVGGGGTFFQMHGFHQVPDAPATSATVNDLKVLDNNMQDEQQMNQLLDTSGSEDGDTPPTS
jgi:hypothetical protein